MAEMDRERYHQLRDLIDNTMLELHDETDTVRGLCEATAARIPADLRLDALTVALGRMLYAEAKLHDDTMQGMADLIEATAPAATVLLPAGLDRPGTAETIVEALHDLDIHRCGIYLPPAVPRLMVVELEPEIEDPSMVVGAALSRAGVFGATVEVIEGRSWR